MTDPWAGIPFLGALLVGVALLGLGGLLAMQFGSRIRELRLLKAGRHDELAAFAEWQARHGQSLIEPAAKAVQDDTPA